LPFSGDKKWCAVRWLLRSAHRAYRRSQGSRVARPEKSSPPFGQREAHLSVGVAQEQHDGAELLGAGGRRHRNPFASKAE